jgi:hypothetical protein
VLRLAILLDGTWSFCHTDLLGRNLIGRSAAHYCSAETWSDLLGRDLITLLSMNLLGTGGSSSLRTLKTLINKKVL